MRILPHRSEAMFRTPTCLVTRRTKICVVLRTVLSQIETQYLLEAIGCVQNQNAYNFQNFQIREHEKLRFSGQELLKRNLFVFVSILYKRASHAHQPKLINQTPIETMTYLGFGTKRYNYT